MTAAILNVRLSEQLLDATRVQIDFLTLFSQCGAVSTFTGIVRSQRGRQQVRSLELDWCPGLSERSIESVAGDAAKRFTLEGLTIIHRCGKIIAGEAIVFVGAAGSHRRETLDAVDYTMDRLKSDVALWKREVGPGLNHWVEPTPKDTTDLRRWT